MVSTKYLSGTFFALYSPLFPFMAVFCHKRTHCFVMSVPPPRSISGLPLGIGTTMYCLRALCDQTTQGTPQGGGGGELAANLLLSFFMSTMEIFLGSLLVALRLETGGVNNQDYIEVCTRFSDVDQDAWMDMTAGDSIFIAMSNSAPQMFGRVPPADSFSVIHQEEP